MKISQRSSENFCSITPGQFELEKVMLLFAAGEKYNIPDLSIFLKHLCRDAIRKHLIELDPHQHLFGRIPQLGLPSLLTRYLLYNVSLDEDISSLPNNDIDLQIRNHFAAWSTNNVTHSDPSPFVNAQIQLAVAFEPFRL